MTVSKDTKELYRIYKDATQKAADLQYSAAVLGWDQEVYMPAKGFPYRGRQLATLSMLAHEMVTNEGYGSLLQELAQRTNIGETEQHNARLSLEDYEKNKKLSPVFIEQITEQSSRSYSAWIEARKANDYGKYAKELERMIALKKQQADMYGYEGHPYNALLDDYEKGAIVAMLNPVFDTISTDLLPLLDAIRKTPQVDDTFFYQHYDKQKQWDFSLKVLKAIGYDFEAGRQDMSEHPFTTSFAPTDVRVTTRVDEENFASLFWSSVHEGGHALYEQGLPEGEYGMPLGAAASLAIHESQSRLWENGVARGVGFWQHFYSVLQQYFPAQLQAVSVDAFYKGMNKVAPSLVRTEADELTYHFHVLIRYEIEKVLISGELNPKDLPGMWNEMYRKYLGITPPDDKSGVLQDVHWAHGSFGYFPTYSLGSFYAVQFFDKAEQDIPALQDKVAAGDYAQLLQWLRTHVHRHGRRYRSDELCRKITGNGLDISAFVRYANDKYRAIYGLNQ